MYNFRKSLSFGKNFQFTLVSFLDQVRVLVPFSLDRHHPCPAKNEIKSQLIECF